MLEGFYLSSVVVITCLVTALVEPGIELLVLARGALDGGDRGLDYVGKRSNAGEVGGGGGGGGVGGGGGDGGIVGGEVH